MARSDSDETASQSSSKGFGLEEVPESKAAPERPLDEARAPDWDKVDVEPSVPDVGVFHGNGKPVAIEDLVPDVRSEL